MTAAATATASSIGTSASRSTPSWRTRAASPETGISAVLSTSTPDVVVDQPISAYPNLAINASGGNLTPYAAHTTSSFVCGTPIDFTLTETSAIGGTRVFHFSFPTCGGGAGALQRNPDQHGRHRHERPPRPQCRRERLRHQQSLPGHDRLGAEVLRHLLLRQLIGRDGVPDDHAGSVGVQRRPHRRRLPRQLRRDQPAARTTSETRARARPWAPSRSTFPPDTT